MFALALHYVSGPMRKAPLMLSLVFLGFGIGALTQLNRPLMNNTVLALIAGSCATLAVVFFVKARNGLKK